MKYPADVVEAATALLSFYRETPDPGLRLPADLVAAAMEPKKGPTPKDLMDLWNTHRDQRLPECKLLTPARRRHCSARLREFPDLEIWGKFIQCINTNDWALGVAPNKKYPHWKANFDWFIEPDKIVKFLEGGFSKKAVRSVLVGHDDGGANRRNPQNAWRDEYGEELERRNAWYEIEKKERRKEMELIENERARRK